MKEHTLDSIAHLFIDMSIGGVVVDNAVLSWIGNKVEKAAKDKIGGYQESAGPFAAWAELSDSTKQDRERKGYPENEPLLRDGTLRDSIEHTVMYQEVQIGSNNPIAEYQELGTKNIPPRSFLGSAAFENTPEIIEKAGEIFNAYLVGDSLFGGKMKIE